MADLPPEIPTLDVSVLYCGRYKLDKYDEVKSALEEMGIEYDRLDVSPHPAECLERSFSALGLDFGDGMADWATQIVTEHHGIDELPPNNGPLLDMYYFAVTLD